MKALNTTVGSNSPISLKGCALLLLISAFQILRVFRDQMAISAGLENAPWLVLGTLCCMQTLLVIIYRLNLTSFSIYKALIIMLILILIIFCVNIDGIHSYWPAATFFILVGSFNLLLVSQFWKILVEVLSKYRSAKTYSLMSVIAGVGAIAGGFFIIQIRSPLVLLVLGICALITSLGFSVMANRAREPGGLLPIKVEVPFSTSNYPKYFAIFILIHAIFGAFLYFWQVNAISRSVDVAEVRASIFAFRDIAVGLLSIVIYLISFHTPFFKAQIWRKAAVVPLAMICLLVVLVLSPGMETALFSIIFFRSGNYSIIRPAREHYYAHRIEINHKKTIVDTVVFRLGDLIGALVFSLTIQFPEHITLVFATMIGLALMWFYTTLKINNELNLTKQ